MMRPPLKLYFPSGPTKAQRAADDAEEIAAVLAGVKAALERKPVTDPKVWSGCPWPEGVEDEDMPYVHVGLFEHLVRCTRGDPSGRMATAIDIAFELGRASIVGKVDPAVAKRLLEGMSARVDGATIGRAESLRRRQAKADEGDRTAFYDRWWKKRGMHLAAGREPGTSKNGLINKIAGDLQEKGGGRGTGERTVRAAIDRWEAEAAGVEFTNGDEPGVKLRRPARSQNAP
jgi:hypothetical protein